MTDGRRGLLLDDWDRNVEAARRVGMVGVPHTGDGTATAAAVAAELLGLVAV